MQAHLLADGRLHLHHGPIDLIIEAFGATKMVAYQRARQRFDGLLQELVDELAELRTPLDLVPQVNGDIAQQMLAAVRPFAGQLVTPMAAVAGAVADAVLAEMKIEGIDKAYVNNGGDVAVYLGENQSFSSAIPEAGDGRVVLERALPWRGIATSGWRGRSHSLGIADSVTVIAKTAAQADVVATMIANMVDLAGHPSVDRQAAKDLMPDSDLGRQKVTVGVGALCRSEKVKALQNGQAYAETLLQQGLIGGALLSLQGEITCVGGAGFRLDKTGEEQHV